MEERQPGDPLPQQSVFDGNDELDEIEREEYRRGIRKARNALFIVGALMFAVDLVMLLVKREQFSEAYFYGIIGFDVLILAVFIGLGLWTKRKPYTAILTGLILFCVIQVFAMIGDPSNIYKGVIVKVIVVITLVSGMKKARALQQLNRIASGGF